MSPESVSTFRLRCAAYDSFMRLYEIPVAVVGGVKR